MLGAYLSSNPNYPALGSLIDVVGCLHYTTNTSTPSFRVCPRNAADITQILGIEGVPSQLPKTVTFSAKSLNVGNRASVKFTLPTAMKVDLGVFDVAGRRVATLASGTLPAAEYTNSWTARGAGVFFYRLTTGGETRTLRTVVIGN